MAGTETPVSGTVFSLRKTCRTAGQWIEQAMELVIESFHGLSKNNNH
jgi:hypothetical protein